MSTEPAQNGEVERPSSRLGLAVLLLAVAPALAAIWAVPSFVTQDGPAHLYNAHIIAQSRFADSPFRDYFRVRWEPLPNWAGHLSLAALASVLPPRVADRLVISATFLGLAAGTVWLRARVAGWRGMAPAALLATLLGLNVTWLFGFYSFLLGACLFPVTLGVWWSGRDRMGPGRLAALSALLVLGYFCHLVSLGLTVVGLAVLAVLTPGPARLARALRTAAALIPLVPLGVLYLSLSRRGGPMRPKWSELSHPTSLAAWGAQIGWVDPISIASRVIVPFVEARWRGFALLAPLIWVSAGLAVAAVATILRRDADPGFRERWAERRGWAALAALLLLGGLVCPDSLGPSHGDYLAQRVILLGLVALVPVLDLELGSRLNRLAAALLAVAVATQSALVWDYALTADRTAGALMRAAPAVGRGRRVASLLVGIRGRFRANPLLHADNGFGLGTGNICWSDYETIFYYFPVQFREGLDRPLSSDLETVAITDAPEDAGRRAALWRTILERHHDAIDVLVVWGRDEGLDAITARWFAPTFEDGRVRVFRPRSPR